MKATKIFYKNLKSKKKIILNIGGARSSKSYSILQLFLYYFLSQKNKSFLICRKTRPALKMSCWNAFLKMLSETDYYFVCEINKTDLTISLPANNNIIYFKSIDDKEKIKSTEFNYIFMEEVNEFEYEDLQVLKLRLSAPTDEIKEPNKLFMALNPVECWVSEYLINNDEVSVIYSTYKDNPFLTKEYIQILENLKNENERLYKIYALGEFAKLENIIYDNYQVVDNLPDNYDEIIYGLDFGFNNPTALVEVIIQDCNNIYLRELIYKTNLTNQDLINELKNLNISRTACIYADASEPARIQEIYNAGFNIKPADKSVMDGIDFCKRKKLFITKESYNLIKEIKAYSFKTDKNGKVLEEPVKFNDHLCDAFRYAIYSHLKNYNDKSNAINLLLKAYE